ncbi:RNA polymerase sigma factor [Chitinophaga sp.]|uniref:RNA polymerase sigma factor n=1 Tax=Chitinophaga sp. TaxID=1869181 RepID=UPI002F91CAD0
MSAYLPFDEIVLLRQLSDNDKGAFETVYNYYFLLVFSFSLKFVEDRQVAEDITLETFVKLWDKRSSLSTYSNISPLLYTIARNACLNHLRDEDRMTRRHQELARQQSDEQLSLDSFSNIKEEIYQHLYLEIEKLPGKMANILQLSLKGFKNAEIAGQTGISEKTVRNLKTEAIKQLRTKLLKNELLHLLIFLSH